MRPYVISALTNGAFNFGAFVQNEYLCELENNQSVGALVSCRKCRISCVYGLHSSSLEILRFDYRFRGGFYDSIGN